MPDFPEPKIPSLSGEETVVGVHHSGVQLQEGLNTNNSRYYCTNCKRKIHCFVKVDRKTKEAIVVNNCTNENCECKCKTHYACKQCGYLHPYGIECNRPQDLQLSDPNNDDEIAKINAEFLKTKNETEVKKPEPA